MNRDSRKAKIIRLLQILFEETDRGWSSNPDDPGRGLTMPQIIERLEDYGISAERKGLYDDLKVLEKCGFDILKLPTRPVQYALASRPFEDEQIGFLIDSVQSSLALTETRTDELIDTILSLAPEYKREPMRERSSACAIAKIGNSSLVYSIDGIKRALTEKKKIRFNYRQYNLQKNPVYTTDEDKKGDGARGGGNTDPEAKPKPKVYLENPITLAYVNDRYYLITYSDKYDGYTHYRVDRMVNVEVLDDEPRTRNEKIANFNPDEYLSKMFGMFSGKVEKTVKFLVNEKGLRSVIDRFGVEVKTSFKSVPDGWVRVFADVSISEPFYAWLCGLGENVRVEEPRELVDGYRAHLELIKKKCFPGFQQAKSDSESSS